MTTIKFPELPLLPEDLPPSLREWCETVESQLQIFRGLIGKGSNTRFTTIQDLVTAGVVADGVIP